MSHLAKAVGVGLPLAVLASLEPEPATAQLASEAVAEALPRTQGSELVTTLQITVELDRGADRGQNFGSLFEAPTVEGKAVIGAGFQGLYNTHHRTDRHVVQLFVRPADGERRVDAEPLPRPTPLAGTYLFDLDGRLFSTGEPLSVWDESTRQWQPDTSDSRERMRLGSRLLTFTDGGAQIDGRSVIEPPERGDYNSFYYAHGHLFFYHTYWADETGYRPYASDDEGFSKLYACPWSPGDGGGVDVTRAAVITLPVVGEVPFSYGQLGDEALTCSNIGGVYVFDGQAWRMVVEPVIDTSYQVYSMLNFYDRLLLGQYPTGELFEYRGADVRHLPGWPPRMEGVSASAREAQTTTIYGGQLFVGVWPWGELWRYHPDTEGWHLVRRMFSQPAITDETVHPYETESAAAGFVANQWGHRVTSLVPMGSDLMVSTSAKSPVPWEPASDFVGQGRWREYGAVTRLTMPGSLSAAVRWTDRPTRLQFRVDGQDMSILQDGELLASTPLDEALARRLTVRVRAEDVTWGRGIFGDFGGASVRGQLE